MQSYNFIPGTFLLALTLSCSNARNRELPENLILLDGDINGVMIRSGDRSLVIYGDPGNNVESADLILFTHARRDVVWAGKKLLREGTKAVIPEGDAGLFTRTDSFWNDFRIARFHDYAQQSTKVPVESIEAYRTVNDGDTLWWQDIPIRVIGSRGYTRGAVSYMVPMDDRRIAFTGDLIYGDGQIMDLYSLQDSIADMGVRGYHGYAARMADLIRSLENIRSLKPDILIPVHGPVIYNPDEAIGTLIDRLHSLYRTYLSVNAFRWYTGQEKHDGMAARVLPAGMPVDWMPLAETRENPDWLIHHVNSKLILSEDSTGFLVDCGLQEVRMNLRRLEEKFPCKDIEGIFVTHYHDDHADFVHEMQQRFDCPAYCTSELKDILQHPGAYRMPAAASNPIPDIVEVAERSVMEWKEFRFTFYYLPGQTIYHDAMLVEHENGESIFFCGDSFSPTGLDDYCLQNRNLIAPGTGYLYSLDLLRTLPENCWIVNQHIDPPFRFSDEQLDFMEQKILERQEILADLIPWDDPNYGIDEGWARFYPYGQTVQPGESSEFSLVINNHSKEPKEYTIRPHGVPGLSFSPGEQVIEIPAKQEGKAEFTLSVSGGMSPGQIILLADISVDERYLHEWCESIIQIGSPASASGKNSGTDIPVSP